MEKNANPYCSCLYYSANALSRIMTKIAGEAFSVTGVAPSHAFLLMAVNVSPGIQPKAISAKMLLTPSTVTRLIEKMEHKGFLERKSNGRATAVYPTEKSIALDPALKKAWQHLYHQYTTLLGEEHAGALTGTVYDAALTLDGTSSL